MGRLITISDITRGLTGSDCYWAYNGMDTLITREVYDTIAPVASDRNKHIYAFERALQAPAMAMMLRGVRINETARAKALKDAQRDATLQVGAIMEVISPWWSHKTKRATKGDCIDGASHKWPKTDSLEECACAVCGVSRLVAVDFNPASPVQVKKLLYDVMQLPVKRNRQHQISTDDECLERLANDKKLTTEQYTVVEAIRAYRGAAKQIGFLKATTRNGRMYSSFNVGAPETGRWSSSANCFGEGTNLQNIAEKNRHIFIADEGMWIFYADLKQAESCFVAYDAEDEAYIEAHLLGDPHTYVSRLLWPELPWTGDIKKDKVVAESMHPPWDPDHSYRFNAKRVQHGSNYGLKPYGIAVQAHIPVKAAADAQERYFDAFSRIRLWQQAIEGQIKRTGFLTTPFKRDRKFFGRLWDDHTIKQGLAYRPQSGVAEILNIGLARVFKELDTRVVLHRAPSERDPNRVWLLAQVHDAILGEVRRGDTNALRRVQDLMRIDVPMAGGRTMNIDVDMAVGDNWGKYSPENSEGIR